jgi:hypothetical protein
MAVDGERLNTMATTLITPGERHEMQPAPSLWQSPAAARWMAASAASRAPAATATARARCWAIQPPFQQPCLDCDRHLPPQVADQRVLRSGVSCRDQDACRCGFVMARSGAMGMHDLLGLLAGAVVTRINVRARG